MKKRRWFWDEEQEVFENGLPFDDTHAANLDDQMLRIKRGFASLVVYDGAMGQGKTTLACLSAEYVMQAKLDFKDQIAMGGEEFLGKVTVCYKKGHVIIIYDEAGDFEGQSHLNSLNKALRRLFQTYRAYRILVFACVPDFSVLDKSIFKAHVVRLVVNCYDRRRKWGNYRGFSGWRINYVLDNMKRVKVASDAYKMTEPNYRGHFKNYSESRSKELDAFSTSGKLEITELASIKANKLRNVKEIAAFVGRSEAWVRAKLAAKKLKPKHRKARKHYYAPEDVAILQELAK